MTTNIANNLAQVHDRIREAVHRRGPGAEVRLIAVSKRHDVAAIETAYAAGQRDFGENYAQEFVHKADVFAHDDVRWHFIGALQSNKAKLIVGRGLIHTVDRPKLVHTLQQRALAIDTVQPVLLEINFDEPQKAGVVPVEAPRLLDAILAAPNLRCDGLMTIPPVGTADETRRHFAALRSLRDELVTRHPRCPLPELSMGMSADYEAAILEGATLVRVGTAIFGERPT